MPMQMMMLGDYYAFSVDTAAYQKFLRADEYRWASMDRLLREPVQQWIGVGLKTIEFNGVIYGIFSRGGVMAGTYQIERMRAEAEQGTPLMLVDGRGNVFGFWCINHVEELATDFADHGGPRKQGFTMKLTHQGDETGAGGALGGAAGAGAQAAGP